MSALDKKQRKAVYLIISSIILLIIGLLIDSKYIFLIAYIIIGYEVIVVAFKRILQKEFLDENFLMTIATFGALYLGQYVEALAVMLFYQIGELFQSLAVSKSRKSISDLMDIEPDQARVLVDGSENIVSPYDVKINDVIVIYPDEKIPLDGIVIEGNSAIDTCALTGESLPKDVSVDDIVLNGSVNLTQVIKVKVTGEYSESTVAKILNLVENATMVKSKSEQFITRFAKIYTPAVVIGALLIMTIMPIITGDAFGIWFERALIFLVVSCPCALVISVPLSFFAAIGLASKFGVLVKGSNYLERISKIKSVIFDKTGTLTKGNFVVKAVHPKDVSEEQLLEVCAYLESYSSHPIGKSIVSYYEKNIDKQAVSDIKIIAGKGISGKYQNADVVIGNKQLMNDMGFDTKDCDILGSNVHVVYNNNYIGHIVVGDELKETTKEAITSLKKLGFNNLIILSGDSHEIVQKISEEIGIDEYYGNLLPSDKVEKVENILQKEDVIFLGDGINDAPVLAMATVGVSMGGIGSDAAIEASDIVLMDDDPLKLVKAIALSKQTMKIVYENIYFALGVKFIILALSIFGIANMWLAIFGDVGVTLIAIFNALRLFKMKN